MSDPTATEQIDAIVAMHTDWRGRKLAELRRIVRHTDTGIVEEVKWKKASKPEGVAVWSHNGTLCLADVLKNAVRLTFPKGAKIDDPERLFNTRLDSKTVRAIDFYENDPINKVALEAIIVSAMQINNEI